MAKPRGRGGRSALSDITPSPGPGPIQSVRERDSLLRCARATEALFGSPHSRLRHFNRQEAAQHLRSEVLADVVRWYWYNDDEDRRTKGSDLKRELTKVVTHLAPLTKAMAAVPQESRWALNRLLKPPTREQPERQDVFGQAEDLNNLIFNHCEPLITPKFTKQASTSVTKAGEALATIWEGISQQPFDRNTKAAKAEGEKLITDRYSFENDGMHFVHVMLQAIDPGVTYSNVRSGLRRVAARAPRTR